MDELGYGLHTGQTLFLAVAHDLRLQLAKVLEVMIQCGLRLVALLTTLAAGQAGGGVCGEVLLKSGFIFEHSEN